VKKFSTSKYLIMNKISRTSKENWLIEMKSFLNYLRNLISLKREVLQSKFKVLKMLILYLNNLLQLIGLRIIIMRIKSNIIHRLRKIFRKIRMKQINPYLTLNQKILTLLRRKELEKEYRQNSQLQLRIHLILKQSNNLSLKIKR